jgi:hypothetical protein
LARRDSLGTNKCVGSTAGNANDTENFKLQMKHKCLYILCVIQDRSARLWGIETHARTINGDDSGVMFESSRIEGFALRSTSWEPMEVENRMFVFATVLCKAERPAV